MHTRFTHKYSRRGPKSENTKHSENSSEYLGPQENLKNQSLEWDKNNNHIYLKSSLLPQNMRHFKYEEYGNHNDYCLKDYQKYIDCLHLKDLSGGSEAMCQKFVEKYLKCKAKNSY